jgi:Zn-dependent M28 family amino/carboxypeptidase
MGNLGEARINNELLINDIQDRLFTTIDQLLNNSELINLNKSLIQNIAETTIFQTEAWLVKNDIMDNIILQSILDHAQLYPQEDKAFISNNSKDFGKPEVQYALRNAGIRYFTITQHFLDWFNSRSLT